MVMGLWRRRGYRVLGGAALAAVVVYYAAPRPAHACTLIGGYSTLTVAVPDVTAADSLRVAAAARGTGPRADEARLDTASGGCVGAACAAGVTLHDFAPDTVALTVAVRRPGVQRVVVPRYDLWYPNGAECPDPTLRAGRVVVPVGP